MTSQLDHREYLLFHLAPQSSALISDSPAPRRAVVFVHGFGGDPCTTWGDFPLLIKTNESWRTTDVFFYGYAHASRASSIDNNSHDFLKFLKQIYPVCPLKDDRVGERIRNYEELVLVGHSEGAVVIREAMILELERNSLAVTPIAKARVSLFAPAVFGSSIVSWMGAFATLGFFRTLKHFLTALSPAATEMDSRAFTEGLHRLIMYHAEKTPDATALQAHILFGRDEQIVVRMWLPIDCYHDPEPNKDHFSVCKPDFRYTRPIAFVDGDCPV